MKTPELSVVVPTIDYLGRKMQIDAIIAIICAKSIAESLVEVIVVDNNPSANGYGLEDSGTFVKIIREPLVGLDRARNSGVQSATGNIVAFLDDDIVPARTWVASLIYAHKSPGVLCVGGPVIIKDWDEIVLPVWFSDYFLRFVVPPKFPQSAGSIVKPYYLIGANMSFKRTVFTDYGLFDINLDRRGSRLLSGGDVEFMMRLKPGSIFYEPLAAVSTKITQQRLTRLYFIRRIFYQAVSDARIIEKRGLEQFYDQPELFISGFFLSLLFKTLKDGLFFQALCMIIRIGVFKITSIFHL